jgi:putative lipoprotein
MRAALLVALLIPSSAAASDPDPWLGRDKGLHFSATLVLASGGYGATALATDQTRWRVLGGTGLALCAGVGKEVADYYGPGDASWKDLTWDIIGTATGVGVAWLIDRIFFHTD